MKSSIREIVQLALPRVMETFQMRTPIQLEWEVDPPKNLAHGDFSTNVAMKLNSVLRKNPREVATQFKVAIEAVLKE